MKGISAVIATILMLVITIALAGTAYLYISGIFTTQTQAIEVSDAFCDTQGSSSISNVTMTIRNYGTNPVTGITCSQTAPSNQACSNATFPGVSITPGNTSTFYGVVGCVGAGSIRTCQYRLTPSSGRTIVTQVTCT